MDAEPSNKEAKTKVLESNIMAAQKGDWVAKNNLLRTFGPLMDSLARKRSDDEQDVAACIEAGKNGLFKAVKKYKQSLGGDKFQVFALDFIEASMDQPAQGGFFSRLFGGNK